MSDTQLYLVTGASSGIGLATTELLLSNGFRVIAVARKEREELKTLACSYPDTLYFQVRDLSIDIDLIPNWIKSLAKQYGKISGVVCAAGISTVLPNRFNSYDKMLEMFNLNLFSALSIAKGFSNKSVMSLGNVSVVFIASVAASIGTTGLVNYGASKAGIIGAAKSLAKELAPLGVRVNSISPGLIKTDLTESLYPEEMFERLNDLYPLGLGKSRYIADAAYFLLSDRASWITGTNMVVDGGISLGVNE
ncbi:MULTISPECIES: SDR family oxidoreductase [Vibrio]|nr:MULTISPECIES: SDR family oxidoreductase [Vibrio]MDE1319358.1 SDR family oxidoreductase [Vibrio aestuarianus]MDF9399684.1 SDR family oxidoreductase [Vibrio sp. 1180_3]CAH8242024.1 Dehydrogenases with different specificities (related to short-chain alcohol dehydrogenases) [Vibrio aestuarianus]